MLEDTDFHYDMELSHTADNKWETMFNDKRTKNSSTWQLEKEYQVALMLQGNKASVYIDGQLLGEGEVRSVNEKSLDFVYFCFGACGTQNSPVTVKNVFLYNRPLNPTEMSAMKYRAPIPNGGPESQVEGVSQTIGTAGSA
ncbi:trans-sialidase, putative, partial [Trypanosoma cruzi marinkellei]